jgi:hypothetical protein
MPRFAILSWATSSANEQKSDARTTPNFDKGCRDLRLFVYCSAGLLGVSMVLLLVIRISGKA